MSTVLSITLKPIFAGWAVCLTDGTELARFHGFGARARAARYVAGVGRGGWLRQPGGAARAVSSS